MQGKTRGWIAASLAVGLLSGCADLLTGMRLGLPEQTAPMMAKDGMAYPAGEGFPGGAGTEQGTGLKGGERDDNADFAAYLAYLEKADGTRRLPACASTSRSATP